MTHPGVALPTPLVDKPRRGMDLTTAVGGQVKYLLKTLTKENSEVNAQEIERLVGRLGEQGYGLLLGLLFRDFLSASTPSDRSRAVISLLGDQVGKLPTYPNFISQAAGMVSAKDIAGRPQFLHSLAKALSMPLPVQLALALAFSHSCEPEVQAEGQRFLKNKLGEITPTAVKTLPECVVHHLLYYIQATDVFTEQAKILMQLESLRQSLLSLVPLSLPPKEVQHVKRRRDEQQVTLPGSCLDSMSLTGILEELGPGCSATVGSFRSVLDQFPRITPQAVGRVVGMMAMHHSSQAELTLNTQQCQQAMYHAMNCTQASVSSTQVWNVANFVQVVRERVEDANFWPNVLRGLDYQGFKLTTLRGLNLVVSVLSNAGFQELPVQPFLGKWDNPDIQISILALCLQAPPDVVSFSTARLVHYEGSPPWASIDLAETLLNLATPRYYSRILHLFETRPGDKQGRNAVSGPLTKCPDLLLVVLLLTRPHNQTLRRDLVQRLLSEYLKRADRQDTELLMRTATENIDTLCHGLADVYLDDTKMAENILNVAIDGKWIEQLMHKCPSAGLLCQIILLSGRRGGPANRLGGPQWLRKVLEGEVKVVPDLALLASTLIARIEKSRDVPNVLELLAVLAEPSIPVLSPAQKQQVTKLCETLKKPASAVSAGEQFAPEVEDEANANFTKMYAGELPVGLLIEALARYNATPATEHHHKVYLCMVQMLFDDIRFFPGHPRKELKLTAKLFGGLIGHNVLDNTRLAHALKFVLTNLAKPQNENVKDFCIWALEEFKHRLPEWQQYCTLLERIKGIDQMVEGIGEYLRPGDAQPRQAAAGQQAHMNQPATGRPDVDGQSQAGDAMTADVQNKINILMSKLDETTADAVAYEIRRFLIPAAYPFLAEYLVVKRASLEPNRHKLLMTLMEKLGNKDFDNAVVQATYTAIKVLLTSEKIRINTSDRSLLKNLGSWLGLQTIARNKPLMARDLDLKGLLFEAFLCGRLIAVVPFVAKVLEHSANSKVFKPPNPWLMGILSLLVDLYQLQDLKLTLKFEVEVLCKNINIPINDLVDTKGARAAQKEKLENIRKELQARGELEQSTDFNPSKKAQAAPMSDVQDENKLWADGAQAAPNTAQPPAQYGFQRPEGFLGQAGFSTEVPLDMVDIAAAPKNQQDASLKQIVARAVEAAFKAVPQSVFDRNVAVACTTTKQLVIKDYATEPDDNKLRKAAGQMVRCLAAHLAMVSCKDVLRQRMKAQLRNDLYFEPVVIDELVKDNMGLAVSAVERGAADMAMQQVEEALAGHMATRKMMHETSLDKNWDDLTSWEYIDNSDGSNKAFLRSLPEPLRPKKGLLYTQKSVYEEFAKMMPASRTAEKSLLSQEQQWSLDQLKDILCSIEAETYRHYQAKPVGDDNRNVLSLTRKSFTKVSQSPQHDNIKKLLCSVQYLIKEDIAVLFARTIFQKVCELSERLAERPLGSGSGHYLAMLLNEVCLFILQSVHEKAPELVVAELTSLFLKSPTRWLNKDVAVNFIRLRLIDVPELDKSVAKAMEAETESRVVVEFACTIVKKCLVDEGLTDRSLLQKTLQYLEANAEALGKKKQPPASDAAAKQQPDAPNGAQPPAASQPSLPAQPQVPLSPTHIQQPQPPQEAQQQQLPPPPQQQQQQQLPQSPGPPLSSPVQAAAAAAKQLPPAEPEPLGLRQPTVRIPSLVTTRAGGQEIRDKVFQLLCDWVIICTQRQAPTSDSEQRPPQAQATEFVSKLQQAGLLRADNMLDKFFALLMEICIEDYCSEVKRCSKEDPKGKPRQPPSGATHPQIFQAVDAFSDLLVLLIKCCAWGKGDEEKSRAEDRVAEVALVSKVVTIVSKVLIHNHDCHSSKGRMDGQPPVVLQKGQVMQEEFKQQPFFRFFSSLLLALNPYHETDSSQNSEILVLLANMFHQLNPTRLPGFAFAWLELISHRIFMPKLLLKKEAGCPHFQPLLVDCLRFLEPWLRKVELTEQIKLFYKGTLKVLLVLLHDFPEFLCNYHFSFCDVIPQTCIQMRNVVLSSFPRTMKLPDPFTPNLKVDQLAEIASPPEILSKYTEAMTDPKSAVPLQEVEAFLNNKAPAEWLSGLIEKLKTNRADSLGIYNVPLVNSLVLHVGIRSLSAYDAENGVLDSPGVDLYTHLTANLCPEGRYLLIGSLANQLRYPNNHTHYFRCVVLHLFLKCCPDPAQQEAVQEQITRVLIERLIVNRPHPWGLLITFIELVKNPTYRFWDKKFIRSSEDITKLFESVGQSCVGPSK